MKRAHNINLLFSLLIKFTVCGSTLYANEPPEAASASLNTPISKILRGKTVCTIISNPADICGIEYWSLYIHQDGSRTMHIASETVRNSEVRHAIVNVTPDGTPHEAFMHNRTVTADLGSTYVKLRKRTVDVTINDSGFESAPDELVMTEVHSAETVNAVSSGPASADGLQFLKYDFGQSGEQPQHIYWVGGSRPGTMVGSVRPTTHAHLGEVILTLPTGRDMPTDHFRMATGTEIWVSKDHRMVVRLEPKFGGISGTRYDMTEYEIIAVGP